MTTRWIGLGTQALVAINVLFGLYALAMPAGVAEMAGWAILEPRGAGELRAVYGGLVGALGVMLAIAWRRRDGSWYEALALGFAGLTLGRLVSLVADGFSTYTVIAAVFEALTAVFLAKSSAALGAARASVDQALVEPSSNDSPR